MGGPGSPLSPLVSRGWTCYGLVVSSSPSVVISTSSRRSSMVFCSSLLLIWLVRPLTALTFSRFVTSKTSCSLYIVINVTVDASPTLAPIIKISPTRSYESLVFPYTDGNCHYLVPLLDSDASLLRVPQYFVTRLTYFLTHLYPLSISSLT